MLVAVALRAGLVGALAVGVAGCRVEALAEFAPDDQVTVTATAWGAPLAECGRVMAEFGAPDSLIVTPVLQGDEVVCRITGRMAIHDLRSWGSVTLRHDGGRFLVTVPAGSVQSRELESIHVTLRFPGRVESALGGVVSDRSVFWSDLVALRARGLTTWAKDTPDPPTALLVLGGLGFLAVGVAVTVAGVVRRRTVDAAGEVGGTVADAEGGSPASTEPGEVSGDVADEDPAVWDRPDGEQG